MLGRFVAIVLSYTLFVIIWGAYVRATSSGAGCGSHWPLCNGQVLPTTLSINTKIEFFHRITSGLSLILILGVGQWTFRLFPRKSFPRALALTACISILLEAIIGAGLVLFELVYHDQSLKRTLSIALHFSNTLVLMAALTLLTATLARDGKGWNWTPTPSGQKLKNQSLLFSGMFIIVSMAGAITALGDTLFPAHSVLQGIHQDLAPTSHFLIKLRVIHPLLAFTFASLLCPWIVSLKQAYPNTLKTPGYRVIALTVLNVIIGISNLAALAPIWLQLIHLTGGMALWIAFILFIDRLGALHLVIEKP